MKRVLIGEFGPIIRLGLHELLLEDGGFEMVTEVAEHDLTPPDVVLIDLDQAGGDGIREELRERYPAARLIAISSSTSFMQVFPSSDDGEFYVSDLRPETLVQAISER